MATPFTLSGTLSFALDEGLPECSRPFNGSSSFDPKHDDTYVLSGSGTQTITLAAAAKGLLIKVQSGALAPVNVRVNGGTDDIELAAGGFIALFNPTPSAGITSISLVHTQNATVRVVVLS